MRRRALIVTAALTLLLSLSAAPPANASVFGPPSRQPLDFQELLSWASSWFTTNLDPDGNPTTGDPLPDPTDPDPTDPIGPTGPDDDRGTNLDPDG